MRLGVRRGVAPHHRACRGKQRHAARQRAGEPHRLVGDHTPGQATSAEFICFLDADDRLEPGYLAAMSEAIDERMEAPGPISATWALYYPAVQYDAQAPRILTPKRPGAHVRDAILDGNWMVIGTAIHRNLFWRAGSFGPERAWEDWALWMRAIMVGAHTCAVPSAIYQATTNANGRNRNIDRPKELFEEIIRANESWRRAQELQQG